MLAKVSCEIHLPINKITAVKLRRKHTRPDGKTVPTHKHSFSGRFVVELTAIRWKIVTYRLSDAYDMFSCARDTKRTCLLLLAYISLRANVDPNKPPRFERPNRPLRNVKRVKRTLQCVYNVPGTSINQFPIVEGCS